MNDNQEMPINSTEQSIANIVNTKRERELDQVLDNLMNDIEKSGEYQPGTIQEERFAKIFLPYFAGLCTAEEVSLLAGNPAITPATWITIAGSANNEVNVVDRNGTVLFTVPPIYTTKYIKPRDNTRENGDLFSTLQKANELKSIRPREAQEVINRAIVSRTPVQDKATKEHFYKRWAAIFDRYGYFDEDEELNQPKATTNDTSLDDLFDD